MFAECGVLKPLKKLKEFLSRRVFNYFISYVWWR